MAENDTIGKLIRTERKKQGLTMEQLGKKMGMSGSLVGRYERDEENPKIETVERFANALDVTVTALYPDGFYSDEVYVLMHSNSTSFQARLLRAIDELGALVALKAYENGGHTVEDMNTWQDELISEVSAGYNIPPETLRKHAGHYVECNCFDTDMVDMSDFSEAGRQVIKILDKLNKAGQEAALRHLQELAQIPVYQNKATPGGE